MNRLVLASVAFLALAGGASSALAADMPVKAPIVAPYYYNWTGFYIGGHFGGAWGKKDWYALNGFHVAGHDVSDFAGGGQVGWNYQIRSWVFGVEVQASWTKLQGENTTAGIITVASHSQADLLWTAAARIGYAWEQSLIYVKGGGAWAREQHWDEIPGFFTIDNSDKVTRSGWMAGVGTEYGLTPN